MSHERQQLAPVDTWPDIRVTFHLLPWCWHLVPRWYVDDVDGWRGHCSFEWLCVDVQWWGNRRMFTEIVHVCDVAGCEVAFYKLSDVISHEREHIIMRETR